MLLGEMGVGKETKGRPWFQLHLSTCVLLMLTGGTMLHLNMRPIEIVESSVREGVVICTERGFPYDLGRDSFAPSLDMGSVQEQAAIRLRGRPTRYSWIIINALICSAIFLGVATFFEWWIRDRARREQWWRDSQEATKNQPYAARHLLDAKKSTKREDAEEEKQ